MTSFGVKLLDRIDGFNERHPWDHNKHYHRWVLGQIPSAVDRSHDIGCGTGDLAVALASRSTRVLATDSDPAIIDTARGLAGATANIRFEVASLDDLAPESAEVITALAVLHHTDFARAIARIARGLTAGGVAVVLGVYREDSVSDRMLGLLAIPANLLVGLVRNLGGKGEKPVAMTARTAPARMTLREIRAAAAEELPGARIRRRLFWRYTLVYRKPLPA